MAAIPFLIWIQVLGRYGLDFPVADQWDTPFFALAEAFSGQTDIATWFNQHNESRKLFPTGLSVLLATSLDTWDTKAELWFGWLLCVALVLSILGVCRTTSWLSRTEAALIALLLSLLLWSPITWFLHMWSITFERLIPETALVAGVWFYLRSTGIWKAAGLAFLAFLAQYSYAGGAMIWPLFLLLLLRDLWFDRTKVAPLGIYLTAFIASSTVYFFTYEPPPHHPSMVAILEFSPGQITGFFLTIIGRTFASHQHQAMAYGLIVVSGFLIAACRTTFARGLDAISSGWVLIGLYGISQALLATAGRLPLNPLESLRPDYVTYGIYPLVATVALVLGTPQDKQSRIIGYLYPAILLLLSYGGGFDRPSAMDEMRHRYHKVKASQSCVHLLLSMPGSETCARYVYPFTGIVARIRQAQELGMLTFAPVQEGGAKAGHVDEFTITSGGALTRGWANLNGTPADGIVFSAPQGAGRYIAAVVPTGEFRPDIAESQGGRMAFAGWSYRIPAEDVRDLMNHAGNNICLLQAQAFDTTDGILRPLNWHRPGCPN
ncbi:MAG: hypothetical protein ACFHX7_17895 [Pseudomonadota bacterium]